MTAQKVFLVLFLILVVGGVGWYVFLYQPISLQAENLKLEYQNLSEKLEKAQNARLNLKKIAEQLELSRQQLREVQNRFITQEDLSRVADDLKRLAQKHGIELKDFTPLLKAYFNRSKEGKISPLPIVLLVEGRYLAVGRYLEDWENFDYYLVPKQISIEKMNPESNQLTVTIFCDLYIRN